VFTVVGKTKVGLNSSDSNFRVEVLGVNSCF
jgi:hypothetical protein